MNPGPATNPELSVIVIGYNMRRELPRTLLSLSRPYQRGCEDINYEVLLMENGSTKPLEDSVISSLGGHFHHYNLESPPSSPAYAINRGAEIASSDVLGIMIDGAHILTPGIVSWVHRAFQIFKNPIVLTRYFFLGPDDQSISAENGYSQEREDALLQRISWPSDGYELFRIGIPLYDGAPRASWLNPLTESNCFFVRRETFEAMGGANELFDFPGGGLLNFDMYNECLRRKDVEPVLLIGEGSFHQYHGGTTTNTTPEDRKSKVRVYKQQYKQIRGIEPVLCDRNWSYLGHQPNKPSEIHMRKRPPSVARHGI